VQRGLACADDAAAAAVADADGEENTQVCVAAAELESSAAPEHRLQGTVWREALIDRTAYASPESDWDPMAMCAFQRSHPRLGNYLHGHRRFPTANTIRH